MPRYATRAKQERRRGIHGRLLCKWCSFEVPAGRYTWCSDKCVQEYLIGRSNVALRVAVFERDGGICAICGLATDLLMRVVSRIRQQNRQFKEHDMELFGHPLHQIYGLFPWARGRERSYWEADHIIAVSEGGETKLSNIRTLCVGCHQKETAILRSRLAGKNS